jgi:hypothetical protein
MVGDGTDRGRIVRVVREPPPRPEPPVRLTPRERSTLKELARGRVGRAVRSGRLVKPALCEDCGAEAYLHGHHTDYSKPLEVVWLCVGRDGCHRKRHPDLGEALFA